MSFRNGSLIVSIASTKRAVFTISGERAAVDHVPQRALFGRAPLVDARAARRRPARRSSLPRLSRLARPSPRRTPPRDAARPAPCEARLRGLERRPRLHELRGERAEHGGRSVLGEHADLPHRARLLDRARVVRLRVEVADGARAAHHRRRRCGGTPCPPPSPSAGMPIGRRSLTRGARGGRAGRRRGRRRGPGRRARPGFRRYPPRHPCRSRPRRACRRGGSRW